MATEVKTEMKNKEDTSGYYSKRERAQRIDFAKIKELLQRNVSKTTGKTYMQYTKELLRTYINSPENNQDNLREISRFLVRNSMLYQKLLYYYAAMPLFYYNITQLNDFTKTINKNKALKDYENVLSDFEQIKLKKECFTALYMALRDGMYVGYMYDSDADGKFFMPLDIKYCRVFGKTPEGEWIIYFDASFFDKGNNKDYIYGVNEDGIGTWGEDFIKGYEQYKDGGRDYQWFRLPPEYTFCLLTCPDDEYYAPLPFFLPLFDLILANLDLNDLIDSRNELENYVLLVSKIPLLNSDEVDDFAVSLELTQQMQELIDAAVPELVGTAYSPMDIEKFTFEKSNTTENQDELSQSVQNIFNNAGASQLVVSGGASTNSIGLKHSIENDISTCWVWVERIQSWFNYFIKNKYGNNYRFRIHKICWYNQEEYIQSMKDSATLGGSALDYLTAIGDSPYIAIQKLNFENAIGIKDLMIPLQSSYNMSSEEGGRPQSNEDDLSQEGANTRSGDKNAETKANS